MKTYTFTHSIFSRDKEGYILDFVTNTYQIISTDTQSAYQQVPPNSILQKICTLSGEVIFDFQKTLPEGLDKMQLRKKLKEFGRNGLSLSEYNAALTHGLIE